VKPFVIIVTFVAILVTSCPSWSSWPGSVC